MATTTRKKNPCSKCDKASGILTCRGCGKDFCYRHVAEHREELNKQMDEVTTNHDQLQQTLTEQQTQSTSHPLIKQIDIWEQNSIEKIHQAANNAREQLLNVVDKHRSKVTVALTYITQELTKARNDDDYVETDLKEWTEKIEKLKIDLAAVQAINFGQDDNETALIPKIFINDILTNSFETWFGDIQVTDNDKLIVHGQTNQIGIVRSCSEYLYGEHRFRFDVLHNRYGYFFGIISRDTSVDSFSHLTPNTILFKKMARIKGFRNETNDNYSIFSTYNSHFEVNDTLELSINCDRQMIMLKNEGTNNTQTFNVNIDKCPLPWRIILGFFYAGDCIRLC